MILRVQIRETSWDEFLAVDQTTLEATDPEIARLRRNGQVQEIEAQNPPDFVLINCIGTEAQLDSFIEYFDAADVGQSWRWDFSGKVDFATEYTGQQDDILATQPAGSTFENPNWVSLWLGQGDGDVPQRFAREFSREFAEAFG